MKKAVYRADPERGGFITTMIAPLNRKRQFRFGVVDAVLVFALVIGAVGLMRLLVAH